MPQRVLVQAGHQRPLQPGHEGQTGAPGEAELVARIQRRLLRLLDQDGNFRGVPMPGRIDDGVAVDAAIFLHADGAASPSARGFSVGFPDSSPLVTSVGGTSLAIDRWGRRMWETGWGTGELRLKNEDWVGSMPFGDFIYGGGGGVSHLYDQPAYQAGVVPAGLSTWKGQLRRAEPDIALDADPQTGVIFTQSWAKPNGGTRQVDSWIGGTSLGAPLLAGMTALANQAWHGSRGPLNPALYRSAGTGVFHDLVPSDGRLAVLRNGLNANGKVVTRLRSLDHDSSLATARGWDNVTGLGSPDASRLLFALR